MFTILLTLAYTAVAVYAYTGCNFKKMVNMISKEKYYVAFFITTLIFLLGIFVGSSISRGSAESFQKSLQLDLLEAQSLEVELSMLQAFGSKEDRCAYIESRIPAIASKKVELGRKFDLGDIPRDETQLFASQFAVSLGRYFVFNSLLEKECNLQKPLILFFKDESEASREQARVLDNAVYRLGDANITVLMFSKETAKDQPIIRLAYALNSVTTTPAIIVKGVKYEGFQTLDKVTDIICSEYGNEYTKSICKGQ